VPSHYCDGSLTVALNINLLEFTAAGTVIGFHDIPY